jgi:hypothetical protein
MDAYIESIVAGETREDGYYHGAAHCHHGPDLAERWDIALTRNSVLEHTVITTTRGRAEHIVHAWAYRGQTPLDEHMAVRAGQESQA